MNAPNTGSLATAASIPAAMMPESVLATAADPTAPPAPPAQDVTMTDAA